MWTSQGRAWHAALNGDRLRLAAPADASYEACRDAAARSAGSDDKAKELLIIDKDIGRTFPERAEFQTAEARERLRRVLGAYAIRHTYCQGMSYVAALMLQHLPESETFWSLAALIERFLPPNYFTDELQGAYMDQHIAFGVFLPHRLPRLAAHLAAVEFPLTLIGVRWFLCLFAADMEPSVTCRIWDLLFAHGAHVLFGLALALLSQHEERLLAAADVPELFSAVRAIGKAAPPWAMLLKSAHSFPSEVDVQVARAAYARQRAQEEEQRRQQREDERRRASLVDAAGSDAEEAAVGDGGPTGAAADDDDDASGGAAAGCGGGDGGEQAAAGGARPEAAASAQEPCRPRAGSPAAAGASSPPPDASSSTSSGGGGGGGRGATSSGRGAAAGLIGSWRGARRSREFASPLRGSAAFDVLLDAEAAAAAAAASALHLEVDRRAAAEARDTEAELRAAVGDEGGSLSRLRAEIEPQLQLLEPSRVASEPELEALEAGAPLRTLWRAASSLMQPAVRVLSRLGSPEFANA